MAPSNWSSDPSRTAPVDEPRLDDFGITAAELARHRDRFRRTFAFESRRDVIRWALNTALGILLYGAILFAWKRLGLRPYLHPDWPVLTIILDALIAWLGMVLAVFGGLILLFTPMTYRRAAPVIGRVRDYLLARTLYENEGRPQAGWEKSTKEARRAALQRFGPSEREAARAFMISGAAQALDRGLQQRDSHQVQVARARLAWLDLDPSLADDQPPPFDPGDEDHVRFAVAVAALTAETPYARCLFRPQSELPFPKSLIRTALELLSDLQAGRIMSPHLRSLVSPEGVADSVREGLVYLDSYVDAPPEALPTTPVENARIGTQYSNR